MTTPTFDYNKESAVMLLTGDRPWHSELHKLIFEHFIGLKEQVIIMVAMKSSWKGHCPVEFSKVCQDIHTDLNPTHAGKYTISLIPNIDPQLLLR